MTTNCLNLHWNILSFLFSLKDIIFIYFWLRQVFVAARGLLFVAVHRLLIAVASLVAEQRL